VSRLQQFLALESAGGIVLCAAAALALILANSPLGLLYTRLLDVRLAGVAPPGLLDSVQLGTAFGLFFGKQLGNAGTIWAATRLGIGRLPEGAGGRQIYGLALLTGIGFTMSLFIGTLAFPAEGYDSDVRISVLLASALSAVCGNLLLRIAAPARQPKSTVTTA